VSLEALGSYITLSPWDNRYAVSHPKLHATWSQYLSEAASLRYQLQVEAALVAGFEEVGLAPQGAGERVARRQPG